ncbi:ribosomal RNA-processing protein 7-domain-containing protein [Hysterangium stoloniferum]|nr:ribosomal RNA-processing protein 7-domain-containing protein [Hysterangium stoloniferum]
MASPSKIAEFTILPILYQKSTQHFLYLKQHRKSGTHKLEGLPNDRTLFVVNIPPDATARELTLFFNPCGHVERVLFQRDAWSPEEFATLVESDGEDEDEDEDMGGVEKMDAEADMDDASSQQQKKRKIARKKQTDKIPPKLISLPEPDLPLRTFRHTGASAHVIFTDEGSLTRALELRTSRVWPPTPGKIAPSGLAHYTALYAAQRPSLSDVKTHADTYLEVYEHNKALTKRKSQFKKGEAIVDEDGFTLVTRGGAYGQTVGGGVAVASKQFIKSINDGRGAKPGRRNKTKAKPHEKDNFYKFQVHEQKRNELVDLKAAFEKDKEKIAELRASRRFNPY